MKTFKVTAIALLSVFGATFANAQDKVEASAGADVVSRYIWRGQEMGDAAIQPTASLSYKGFSLSAWGSFGFLNTKEAKELDLTLAYSTGGLNVGITDYYFSNRGVDNKYLMYQAHKTAHVFEANIGYDFGPVAVQWFTNIAGDDGVNKEGKRAYSSYVELSAPFKLAGLDWDAAVGAVPYTTSFYNDAHSFAVTNVSVKATKDMKITKKINVPVFAQLSANPSTQKAYLIVGFTVNP